MKVHLLIGGMAACGELPTHSPLIRDPRRVTCRNCRRTKVFMTFQREEKSARKIQKLIQAELF